MDSERARPASEIKEPRSWHSLSSRDVISELGSDASELDEEEAKVRLRCSVSCWYADCDWVFIGLLHRVSESDKRHIIV